MTGDRCDPVVGNGPLLVSACLLGLCTRLDGGHNARPAVAVLAEGRVVVPVCPEQLGGLPTPRPPAEIRGGNGRDVLAGRARVVTSEGVDLTEEFLRGGWEAVKIARLVGAEAALLKARSPSCGVYQTYDGSFLRRLQEGPGVAAACLERQGLRLLTEEDLDAHEDGAVGSIERRRESV